MQRSMILIAFLLSVAATASAQIGKSVSVSAGTPEDKALTEIYGAPDGPEKVALLDKFMADFGKGDMELLADQLYVQTYLAQKNYAKVYGFASKALALDPSNLSAAVSMFTPRKNKATQKSYTTRATRLQRLSRNTKTRLHRKGLRRSSGRSRRRRA